MEELEKFRETEQTCVDLIYEFLRDYDLLRTYDEMIRESSENSLPALTVEPPKKSKIKREHVAVILNLLQSSNHTEFFNSWTSLIPEDIQHSIDYKKLTIYLYVYFTTLTYRTEDWASESRSDADVNPELSDSSEQVQEPEETNRETSGFESVAEASGNEDVVAENPEPSFNVISSPEEPENPDNAPVVFEESSVSVDELKANGDENFDAETLSNNDDIFSDSSVMEMYKIYLAKEGSEFTTEPEFLPYFALPFIKNPKTHPTFSIIFNESWVNDLKARLTRFLIEYSFGDSVVPELIKLANNAKKSVEDRATLETLKIDADEHLKRYKDLRRRFNKLRKDHQSVVGVASELAVALENSVKGQAVDLKDTLENCINIYPDLFSKTQPNSLLAMFDKAGHRKGLSFSDLDVNKVKHDLTSGSIKSKLLLLQALRWHITRSNIFEREQGVSWIARQDILGLHHDDGGNFRTNLIPGNSPHPLQQAMARFVNALASLRVGRSYLLSSKGTLSLLVQTCVQSNSEPITIDMIIATLQKLSIRKMVCEELLSSRMIEWLLYKLGTESTGTYSLEYGTSLLMNLAMHAPTTFWEQHITMVISTLLKLLTSNIIQVLEYVYGTLYCVLRNDKINSEFKKSGLENALNVCLNGDIKHTMLEKQVEALIKLHRREITVDAVSVETSDYTEDDLDDPDQLDPEIDYDDPVKGSLSGESLLEQNYTRVFPVKSVVDRSGKYYSRYDRISVRPSTPRSYRTSLSLSDTNGSAGTPSAVYNTGRKSSYYNNKKV